MSSRNDAVSKYANLPGIATDQPDVYETSDLPESDQLGKGVRPSSLLDADHSDNVEILKVAASDAFKRFDGCSLSGDRVDFREMPVIRRAHQSWGEWEVAAQQSREKETPLQRYHRLQTEMSELMLSLNAMNEQSKRSESAENGTFTGDLTLGKAASHLENLTDQLKSLNIDQWVENDIVRGTKANLNAIEQLEAKVKTAQAAAPSSTSSSTVTYELQCRTDQGRASNMAEINRIEQKIKRLENLIGNDDQKLSFLTNLTNGKSVSEAVNVLSIKVSQLDASSLDSIDGRLTSILHKLTQISDKKNTIEDAEKLNKIVKLHELVVKTDKQRAAIPAIASRLNSLSELQEQGNLSI